MKKNLRGSWEKNLSSDDDVDVDATDVTGYTTRRTRKSSGGNPSARGGPNQRSARKMDATPEKASPSTTGLYHSPGTALLDRDVLLKIESDLRKLARKEAERARGKQRRGQRAWKDAGAAGAVVHTPLAPPAHHSRNGSNDFSGGGGGGGGGGGFGGSGSKRGSFTSISYSTLSSDEEDDGTSVASGSKSTSRDRDTSAFAEEDAVFASTSMRRRGSQNSLGGGRGGDSSNPIDGGGGSLGGGHTPDSLRYIEVMSRYLSTRGVNASLLDELESSLSMVKRSEGDKERTSDDAGKGGPSGWGSGEMRGRGAEEKVGFVGDSGVGLPNRIVFADYDDMVDEVEPRTPARTLAETDPLSSSVTAEAAAATTGNTTAHVVAEVASVVVSGSELRRTFSDVDAAAAAAALATLATLPHAPPRVRTSPPRPSAETPPGPRLFAAPGAGAGLPRGVQGPVGGSGGSRVSTPTTLSPAAAPFEGRRSATLDSATSTSVSNSGDATTPGRSRAAMGLATNYTTSPATAMDTPATAMDTDQCNQQAQAALAQSAAEPYAIHSALGASIAYMKGSGVVPRVEKVLAAAVAAADSRPGGAGAGNGVGGDEDSAGGGVTSADSPHSIQLAQLAQLIVDRTVGNVTPPPGAASEPVGAARAAARQAGASLRAALDASTGDGTGDSVVLGDAQRASADLLHELEGALDLCGRAVGGCASTVAVAVADSGGGGGAAAAGGVTAGVSIVVHTQLANVLLEEVTAGAAHAARTLRRLAETIRLASEAEAAAGDAAEEAAAAAMAEEYDHNGAATPGAAAAAAAADHMARG